MGSKKRRQDAERRTDEPSRSAGPQETGVPVDRSHLFNVLVAAAVVTLVFFLYSPAIDGPFLFDDVVTIQQNQNIQVKALNLDSLQMVTRDGPSARRPVALFTFALDYYVHGLTTTGFHVVNIAIHLLCGFLLFYFVTLTLRLPSLRHYHHWRPEIAFVAAALWLVHPLATQSVAYIVQRMTSLATMFFMLALISYVRGRLSPTSFARWAWYAGCGTATMFALGSKEIAVTVPVIILLYEWYFFQNLSRTWLRRASPVLAVGAVVGLAVVFQEATDRGYSQYGFNATERLMTEARVVVYYLSLIALPAPFRLSVEYDLAVSKSLLSPVTTLLSIGFIVGLLALAWRTAKSHRLISFGILWYFVNLALESTVIPLDLVAEHRTYLPSMGVVLIAVATVCASGLAFRQRLGAFAAVALLLSTWTYQRSHVWTDELVLWEDTVSKHPNFPRAQYNLARTRVNRQDYKGALESYSAFIMLNPAYADAYFNRGAVKKVLGGQADAIGDFTKAIELDPKSAEAYASRGNTRRMLGEHQGAIEDEDRAIELKPDHKTAHIDRGLAKIALKDFEGALVDLTRAVEITPDSAVAYVNLGHARYQTGDIAGAREAFSLAIERDPLSQVAYLNRAVTRHDLRDYAGAVDDYTVLLKLNPQFARAFYNRGHDRVALQDRQGACADFRQAAQLAHPGADANVRTYCR